MRINVLISKHCAPRRGFCGADVRLRARCHSPTKKEKEEPTRAEFFAPFRGLAGLGLAGRHRRINPHLHLQLRMRGAALIAGCGEQRGAAVFFVTRGIVRLQLLQHQRAKVGMRQHM